MTAESQTAPHQFIEFGSGMAEREPHLLPSKDTTTKRKSKSSATTIYRGDFEAQVSQLQAIKNHKIHAPFQFSLATAVPEVTSAQRKTLLVALTNHFHTLLPLKYDDDHNFRLHSVVENPLWIFVIHVNHLRSEYPITATVLLLKRDSRSSLFQPVSSFHIEAELRSLADAIVQRSLDELFEKARHSW